MPLPDGINADDLTNVPVEVLQAVITLQKASEPAYAASLQLEQDRNKVTLDEQALAAAKGPLDTALTAAAAVLAKNYPTVTVTPTP